MGHCTRVLCRLVEALAMAVADRKLVEVDRMMAMEAVLLALDNTMALTVLEHASTVVEGTSVLHRSHFSVSLTSFSEYKQIKVTALFKTYCKILTDYSPSNKSI